MSWSVFQKGDVVYHPVYGKGEVVRTEQTTKNSYNAEVFFDDDPGKYNWFSEKTLSFKPWSEPCHVRPFERGWYVLRYKGIYTVVERKTAPAKDVRIIKYLGKEFPQDWEEEDDDIY